MGSAIEEAFDFVLRFDWLFGYLARGARCRFGPKEPRPEGRASADADPGSERV